MKKAEKTAEKPAAKTAKTAASRAAGWHYPPRGDYPPKGESVLCVLADTGDWIKAHVRGEAKSTVGLYQQNSRYRGRLGGTAFDLWDGIPIHAVVAAWRKQGADPEREETENAVLAFEKLIASDDTLLALAVASAYGVDPRKNGDYLNGLVKKFKKTHAALGASSVFAHGSEDEARSPMAYRDGETLYATETRFGHGVIVQAKGEARPRYAFDFPQARKIYPTERDARLALMAEAERRRWKRIA